MDFSTRMKILKLHRAKRARKPIPAHRTKDGIAVKVGKPYWWAKDYRRPRMVWGGDRPDTIEYTVVRHYAKTTILGNVKRWLEDPPRPETPKAARELAETLRTAGETLTELADEFTDSRDNMPCEGSPIWNALNTAAEGCEYLYVGADAAADLADDLADDWPDDTDDLDKRIKAVMDAIANVASECPEWEV